MWTIRNHKTGQVIVLSRDVCHNHPAWVHEQCADEEDGPTYKESDIQNMLDQFHVSDFLDHPDERDICGIGWEPDGNVVECEQCGLTVDESEIHPIQTEYGEKWVCEKCKDQFYK